MKNLKIARDTYLPLDFVTQAAAILAKRRAGKSYTMRRIAEQLLEAEQQIVLVDPKGDQWGIRSSADGKNPGYPITILGGEHGDVPLEVGSGELVAKLVVEERVSVLLDLSIFRKHEIATFMTAFMENLYRLKAQESFRTPVMLIIDEADAIAPQKPQKGEERMLGAAEDIVRRGGQRGIGCLLITQRSAVLNKNVLTQAQMLIVLRTIAPQDLAAMKSWIEVHGTLEEGKQLMESLPSLPIGDAWFWSPGWPTNDGIFHRAHVFPITTFDSGATPKPGEKKIIPKNLADIDLEALKKQMSETIEKAKNDDPKLLRAEIKRLTELKSPPLAPQGPIGVSQWREVGKSLGYWHYFERQIIENTNKDWIEVVRGWKFLYFSVKESIDNILKFKDFPLETPNQNVILREYDLDINKHKLVKEKEPGAVVSAGNSSEHSTLSKGARAVLSYLHSIYPGGRTKTQIWVATGYSPGGGFNNLIYELTGKGLIYIENKLYKSAEYKDINLYDENFHASLDLWKSKLGKGARSVLEVLLRDNDLPLTKEDLAQKTGYKIGGGFNNNIYELTGAELIKKVSGAYIVNPEILNL